MPSGFERNINQSAPPTHQASKEAQIAQAKQAGYTGNICDVCGSTRMKMAGHCMVCDDCGTTTGCS